MAMIGICGKLLLVYYLGWKLVVVESTLSICGSDLCDGSTPVMYFKSNYLHKKNVYVQCFSNVYVQSTNIARLQGLEIAFWSAVYF